MGRKGQRALDNEGLTFYFKNQPVFFKTKAAVFNTFAKKYMIRKCIKVIFLLFVSALVISCSRPQTFTRDNAARDIEKLSKERFDLDVVVKDIGQTFWVYLPIKHMNDDYSWKVTDKGFWEKEIEEKIQNVTYVLHKVLFSLEKPPRFYCLINSNIEMSGMDQYNIAFLDKEVIYMMERELLDDVASKSKGSISFRINSPRALGDVKGEHIYTYDLCLDEFVKMTLLQKIYQSLNSLMPGDHSGIKSLKLKYDGSSFFLYFHENEDMVNLSSFSLAESIKSSCEEILEGYSQFMPDTQVEIINLSTDQKIDFKVRGKKGNKPLNVCHQSKDAPTLINILMANIYYKTARTYYYDQDYILAEEFLKESLNSLKDFLPSIKLLASVYNSSSQYKKSEVLNRKYLEAYPQDINGYLRLGESLIYQNKYEESLLTLKKALAIDYNNPKVLTMIGDAYRGFGDYKKAADNYTKAQNYNLSRNQRVSLLKKLGKLNLLAGQPSLASSYFDELLDVLESDKERIDIHKEIAKEYLLMEEYELARISYIKALDLSEIPDAQIYYSIGFCLQNIKEYEDAISNYKKALEIDPEYYQAYFGIGYCYFSFEDFENSLEYYKQGLSKKSDISAVYVQMGIVYSKLNQYTAALFAFNKAIELNPQDYLAFYNQGWVYNELLQYGKAEHSFKEALKIDLTLASAYHGLGISQLKQKKFKQAKKNLQKAKSLFFNEDNFKAIEIIEQQMKTIP